MDHAGHSGHAGHGREMHHGASGHGEHHGLTHDRFPWTDAGGLDAGVDYAHAPGGVHDLGQLGLHHVSLSNFNPTILLAEIIALEAAGFIGDPQGMHGFHEGYVASIIPNACHCEMADKGDDGRHITWGKNNKDLRLIETWTFPHGECDPMRFIDRLATAPKGQYIPELAAAGLGMRRLYQGPMEPANIDVPIFSDRLVYQTFDFVTSAVPFTAPDHATNKPNLWYRGCPGKTRIARRTYQLFRPGMEFYRSYLIVSVANWCINIKWRKQVRQYWVSKIQYLVWTCEIAPNGVWRFKWDQILEHRKCAEALAEATDRYIKARVADPYAVAALRDLKPALFEPIVPRKVVEAPVFLPGIVGAPAHDTGMGVDEDDARRWSTEQQDGMPGRPKIANSPY